MTEQILPPGTIVQVIKLRPDGSEAARYAGEVIEAGAPEPWIAVRAVWTLPRIELPGLAFTPGDILHEYFSPAHWFNVFAVFSPDGALRGWYGNVTYPVKVESLSDRATIAWQDLYIDLIGRPDGWMALVDEDELEASGLGGSDEALYRHINSARDEMVRLCESRMFPFHER